LARRQHWVVARAQLLALGFHPKAIEHRVEAGRLFPVHAGVYAVGRRALCREGQWLAAVLACGPDAFLSHRSAGFLWEIIPHEPCSIDIAIRVRSGRRRPGIKIHCRPSLLDADITRHNGIPVTNPLRTLLDLANILGRAQLERAVNEADRLDLIDPESLRAAIEDRAGEQGVRPLRALLDRHTYRLTESELERRFLRIARAAGLPAPETQATVNGIRVDFFWPELGLIVETDGLRYHRTPATQSRDARRDQAHTAAGLTALRFSHAQVRYERPYVEETLRAVASRLAQPGVDGGAPFVSSVER
jgi:very-short-patch-repair endonuclease